MLSELRENNLAPEDLSDPHELKTYGKEKKLILAVDTSIAKKNLRAARTGISDETEEDLHTLFDIIGQQTAERQVLRSRGKKLRVSDKTEAVLECIDDRMVVELRSVTRAELVAACLAVDIPAPTTGTPSLDYNGFNERMQYFISTMARGTDEIIEAVYERHESFAPKARTATLDKRDFLIQDAVKGYVLSTMAMARLRHLGVSVEFFAEDSGMLHQINDYFDMHAHKGLKATQRQSEAVRNNPWNVDGTMFS